ncbi:MAG: GNAT family N-acetyltransferase [Sphingomonadales bacterium]|jgi:GNAT superfamily N-acetyltransferase
MADTRLTHRLATLRDCTALEVVMKASIEQLQSAFLTPEQIEASWFFMGIDTQLIKDKSYFVIESEGRIAGCGGWSYRATLYGGDNAPGRSPDRLAPHKDAAKIRAMYTHPDFARRGVGKLIIKLCEDAARKAGFKRAEMMATLAGEPLYRACGYEAIEQYIETRGRVPVPLIKMGKDL